MAEMDREFQRLARLDQDVVEKETSAGEELAIERPYESQAGEGAENIMDREARADVPSDQRGYRRLDEPQ